MRFGSPLQAAQGTAPTQSLDVKNLAPGANQVLPTLTTYYDVSAFTAVMVRVFTNGYAAGNRSVLQANFYDNKPSHSIIGALLKIPTLWRVGPTSNGQVMLYRTLGPALQITVDTVPAACTLDVLVFGLNAEPRFDGPYTPSMEGTEVAIINQAFAIGANVNTGFLQPYTGPAKLFVQGQGGGTCSVFLVDDTGLGIQGTQVVVPAAGNLGTRSIGQVDVWVPPQPSSLTVINGGAAQTCTAVLTSA